MADHPTNCDFRNASRRPYARRADRATYDELKIGALFRIADALEDVAQDYRREREAREWAERQVDRYRRALNTEQRRNAALRGVIGRMKRARAR